MPGVPLAKARYFIWVIVPVAICAVLTVLGSPYLIWSYTWQGAMMGDRYYTSCTYVGQAGPLTRAGEGGKCHWIIFVRAAEA